MKVVTDDILLRLNEYKKSLKDGEVVTVAILDIGTDSVIRLTSLDVLDSGIVCIKGTIGGDNVEIMQHITKLNLMFRPIGR